MKPVWVDTSAVVAMLDRNDQGHQEAAGAWTKLIESDSRLATSDYVIAETAAVVQRRLGMDSLRKVAMDLVPVLDIDWVDEELMAAGMAAVLAAGRRDLSLVDCVSFEAMRRRGIGTAFTLDPHFREQGFDIVPE